MQSDEVLWRAQPRISYYPDKVLGPRGWATGVSRDPASELRGKRKLTNSREGAVTIPSGSLGRKADLLCNASGNELSGAEIATLSEEGEDRFESGFSM